MQKVGYRTFINSLAVSHNLTGIAENLPDGSVKVVTEVIREKVTSLEEIQRYSYIDLRDKYDQLSAHDAPFSRLQK